MKGKSYYSLLVGLILIGIWSFNFYQHKQEERLLEFEGYEISSIEERVDALYNEEKTDIVEDISEDEFEDLDQVFLDLKEKDLRKESKRRIQDMELDFLIAREMHTIQEDIRALFEKDVIISSAELKDIGRLAREIEPYSIRPDYYERNTVLLEDGKKQLTDIREATELVESMLDDEGNLQEGVTQEDIDEALERIYKIKNKEIRDTLAASLDGEIIEVEEEDEEEEIEEMEEIEETPEEDEPASTPTQPTRPTNPSPGNDTNPGPSSGDTGAGSGNGSDGGNTDGTGSGSGTETGGENNSGEDDGEDETVAPVAPTPTPEQPAEPVPPVEPEEPEIPFEPEQPIEPDNPDN